MRISKFQQILRPTRRRRTGPTRLGLEQLEIRLALAADPVLNEFVADHTGTDSHEFVEVFGDPSTDYSAFQVLQIEGDGTGAGTVDSVFQVGTTDAGGFWVSAFSSNVLENGTLTLLLVEGFTGSVGNDLDTNNDGTLDATPWTRVVDAVGVTDGGGSDHNYSSVVLKAGFDGLSFPPGGASRIPDGFDTDSLADWVRNDFDGKGLPGFVGTPVGGEALNTPGASNQLAAANPLINEFVFNHVGADTDEFIEVWGTASTSYSAFHVLEYRRRWQRRWQDRRRIPGRGHRCERLLDPHVRQ